MKMIIVKHNGRWSVNDKPYQDLNQFERNFMNNFWKEVKIKNNTVA